MGRKMEIYDYLKDAFYGIIAVYGLVQWKKPLKSKTNHDLAKSLLSNVLKVRDELRTARNLFSFVWEMDKAIEVFNKETSAPITDGIKIRLVPSLRFRKVHEKYLLLYEDKITARD